jgi:uncharacterized protein with ATP-grasp and redox domains
MAIESECIVCRMRQALDVCNFVGADEITKQSILKRVMEILIDGIESDSPDGVGFLIQTELKRLTNHNDPYKKVKAESIQKALELYPELVRLVENSSQKLKTAVELCIAGNVIDFGPSNKHDIELAVRQVMEAEKSYFDFREFAEELKNARMVLVLGDNAGETVFDRLLMEQVDKQFYYAVKGEAVLNDAIFEDAVFSGIGRVAEIINNGSPMSGTVLPRCSSEFKDIFYSADMVISKGQANFETLAEEKRRIFFLFKVKCMLLCRKHNLPLNEYVLLDNRKFGK